LNGWRHLSEFYDEVKLLMSKLVQDIRKYNPSLYVDEIEDVLGRNIIAPNGREQSQVYAFDLNGHAL